eukprot:TRINITY_DN5584_c0_g2_i1.p1 TRINITY_DN5584_c0_g2~~TRINITY_DN5584_c0_g2_i1.p1  ORF type:complete len:133 (-),score=23.58 TRINITY_DN5584_c0_g2_i1:118-516(-)
MASSKGSLPMLASILAAHLTQVKNNDQKSVLDVWPGDKYELDNAILKPLTQVFSYYGGNSSSSGSVASTVYSDWGGGVYFGLNVDLSKHVIARILYYVDYRTMHLVVPCVNHSWRYMYKEYQIYKRRLKLMK